MNKEIQEHSTLTEDEASKVPSGIGVYSDRSRQNSNRRSYHVFFFLCSSPQSHPPGYMS